MIDYLQSGLGYAATWVVVSVLASFAGYLIAAYACQFAHGRHMAHDQDMGVGAIVGLIVFFGCVLFLR